MIVIEVYKNNQKVGEVECSSQEDCNQKIRELTKAGYNIKIVNKRKPPQPSRTPRRPTRFFKPPFVKF